MATYREGLSRRASVILAGLKASFGRFAGSGLIHRHYGKFSESDQDRYLQSARTTVKRNASLGRVYQSFRKVYKSLGPRSRFCSRKFLPFGTTVSTTVPRAAGLDFASGDYTLPDRLGDPNPDAVICKSVAMEWARLQQAVLKSISNSLPEVSKDYKKSQQSVATQKNDGLPWLEQFSGYFSKKHIALRRIRP